MTPVIQCANPFLPLTTVWMYDQIRTLKRYHPVVITQLRQNVDLFPVSDIFSAEDLSLVQKTGYRLIRKLRGTYAGYEGWIKKVGGRLIHAHFGQEGFRCLAAKKNTNLPMVTTFYGLDVSKLPRERLWHERFKRLFHEGELFLAEGSHMAKQLVAIGCDPGRVQVHHLGVDLKTIPFCPDKDAENPVVLTYAAFREKKGLIYALRAFAQIADAHPKATMRMIGDGPLRRELESEIATLGIQERVKMLGFLTHSEAVQELQRATVLLYPSVTAQDGDTEGGAPVGVIEALAAGTAVVSTLHADIPEVVPNETCGLLFPERDIEGLAEGVDAILASEKLREEIAIAGRTHVQKEHDLMKQAEKLEIIYDGLVGQ